MEIFDTPHITLSTMPTGGVMRPMALFMMNSTPKYTGSMPACMTTGISTGVRIISVGAKSSAVPTITTMTMITNISRILLPMKGSSMAATWLGTSEVVISQAETSAAAIRNTTTAVLLAAATSRP
ncbi:hypothetical protein D9M68_963420 [compost metagenome]